MSLAFIVPERNTQKLEVSCIIQESFDVQRRSSFHLKEFHTYPASLCIAGSISSFDCRKVDFYFLTSIFLIVEEKTRLENWNISDQ